SRRARKLFERAGPPHDREGGEELTARRTMRTISQLTPVVRRALLVIGIAAIPAAASAQQVEFGIDVGYTASEGITASESRVILGQVYNSLDLTSGGAVGFTLGAFIGPRWEVEFLYSRQSSTFEISDPAPSRKLANQDIENYHGNIVYNWGESQSRVRPYAFFGLGATHYLPGDYDSSLPNSAQISKIATASKFSTTWGGGVKFYASANVGVKASLRWTPTYIKTDADGIWCDPFYPTCC